MFLLWGPQLPRQPGPGIVMISSIVPAKQKPEHPNFLCASHPNHEVENCLNQILKTNSEDSSLDQHQNPEPPVIRGRVFLLGLTLGLFKHNQISKQMLMQCVLIAAFSNVMITQPYYSVITASEGSWGARRNCCCPQGGTADYIITLPSRWQHANSCLHLKTRQQLSMTRREEHIKGRIGRHIISAADVRIYAQRRVQMLSSLTQLCYTLAETHWCSLNTVVSQVKVAKCLNPTHIFLKDVSKQLAFAREVNRLKYVFNFKQ